MRTLKMAVHAGNPGPYVHKVINKLVDRLHTAKNWLVRPAARAGCTRWSACAVDVGMSCAWHRWLLKSPVILPQLNVLLPVRMGATAAAAAAAVVASRLSRLARSIIWLLFMLPSHPFAEPMTQSAQIIARPEASVDHRFLLRMLWLTPVNMGAARRWR